MAHRREVIDRFYSLDVLRGVAALCVVFWHWQHFFITGTAPITIDLMRLPLSEWIFVLYTSGWMAVDFFFTLSGFIFYWLYSRSVAQGDISPSKFFLLRFSRLYPLHAATLIIVALGQVWMVSVSGGPFVYQNNDIKHFLLNIFFVSSWGIESGYSFNGPVWSVSVEILLYAIFYVVCRILPLRFLIVFAMSLAGFFVVQNIYAPVGRGVGSFFLGGCIFLFYQLIVASRFAHSATTFISVIACGLWVLTLSTLVFGLDLPEPSLASIPLLKHLDVYFKWVFRAVLGNWVVLVLFPLAILSFALIEAASGPIAKPVAFLGDISYSSYLLHFPLQMIFASVVTYFAINNAIYYSPYFMALFFSTLVSISLVSFHYFEVPVQRFIRQTATGRSFITKPKTL